MDKFPLKNIQNEEFDNFQICKAKIEGLTDQYTLRKELKGKKKNIITKSSVGHYFIKPNLNTNIPKLKKKALQKDGLLLPPKVGIF